MTERSGAARREAPLAPGLLLHDRYRLLASIGRGGMGTVYEALDTRLGHHVAVKQTRFSDEEAARAFETEARLLAALRHPGLPVVTDYFGDDHGLFLVMQYIPGDTLADVLARAGRPLPWPAVREWVAALAATLEYLHGHQPPIVHRDLKPANLKLTPRGEIILLDFGLAKGPVGTRGGEDAPSVLGCSPRYSPPEQMTGEPTDPRSDIYAFGATLFHLLTASEPPSAVTRVADLAAGRPDSILAPHVLNPEVPPGVSGAIMRAMSLAPEMRFATAPALREALLAQTDPWTTVPVERRGGPESARRLAVGQLPETIRVARHPVPQPRRVDTAVPATVEAGRRIDVIAQVRFTDSPRLCAEDWPWRDRPAALEQGAESIRVTFPVNPATGALIDARLRLRLVAPDCVIDGDAERAVDVPPDAYSKRVIFALKALRTGACRMTLDVYGADSTLLGTVPLETTVERARREEAPFNVAALLLNVVAQQLSQGVAPGSLAAVLAGDTAVTMPVPPLVPTPVPVGRSDSEDTGELATVAVPATAAPSEALPREVAPPSSRRGLGRRLSTWGMPMAAAVVLGVVGVSYLLVTTRPGPASVPTLPPVAGPPYGPPPAAAPPSATAPLPAPPTAVSPSGSPPAAAPPPPQLATAPPTLITLGQPVASSNLPLATLTVESVDWTDPGRLRLQVAVSNASTVAVRMSLGASTTVVTDARGRRLRPIEDLGASQSRDGTAADIPAGTHVTRWIEFMAQADLAGPFTIWFTTPAPMSDVPMFPRIRLDVSRGNPSVRR